MAGTLNGASGTGIGIGARSGARAGGFTLIELLVVIGIISLLVTLLLPSISAARKSSQRAAGVINMRSISTLLSTYADDSKGAWFNSVFTQGIGGFCAKTDAWFASDGYMPYGASTLVESTYGTRGRIDEVLSPADFGYQKKLLAARMGEATAATNSTWPSSFYYSPTVFRGRSRFITSAEPFRDPQRETPFNDVALNLVGDVAFPSAKVVLFERRDFLTPTRARPAVGGKARAEPLPPAFNSPKASINVMTADGSSALVRVIELMEMADAGLQSGDWTYVPVDHLPIPDDMPTLAPDEHALKPAAGTTIDYVRVSESDAEYLYFFAGTRDGVRGRDLAR